MTVSEVARGLGLDKAAAYRHLRSLIGAGLVERRGTGRKWVYYRLVAAPGTGVPGEHPVAALAGGRGGAGDVPAAAARSPAAADRPRGP